LFVTILGVDHELQNVDATGDFRKMLEGMIDEGLVHLIAEEAKQNYPTIPRRVAESRSIDWLGVDTTLEDKNRLGITDELTNRPTDLLFDESTNFGAKGMYLPNADGLREELWVLRTLESRSEAAIFVCGMLHLQKLAERFISAGCEVVQINVCDTEWYRQNYGTLKLLTDDDGNLWYEARFATPKPIY
jgi:hypothetical protein